VFQSNLIIFILLFKTFCCKLHSSVMSHAFFPICVSELLKKQNNKTKTLHAKTFLLLPRICKKRCILYSKLKFDVMFGF